MTDQLAIVGVFMLGASAGSLVDRIFWRIEKHAWGGSRISEADGESVPSNYRMAALIVSRNPEVAAIFSAQLREIYVQSERRVSVSDAIQLLSSRKFELLVLDFDDLPAVVDVASTVRIMRPNYTITVFAVASENQRKTAALAAGSTFVVEQPLDPQQIRILLRTTYEHMLISSQPYFRLNIEIPGRTRSRGPA